MSDGAGQPLTTPVIRMRGARARKGVLKRRTKGFTLIEITLVIAIGLGLIVGGLLYFQKLSRDNEMRDALTRIGMIRAEVAAQYAGTARRNWLILNTDAASPLETSAFAGRSGLPASAFRGMRLRAGDIIELYRIELTDLEPQLCRMLAGNTSRLGNFRFRGCAITDGKGMFYVSYGSREVGQGG